MARVLKNLVLTDRRFDRLVLAFMAVGFVALVIAGGGAALVTARNQEQTRWVTHTYEVERAIFTYRLLFERLETARRGFMLTRSAVFLQGYDQSRAALPGTVAAIGRLTVDNGRQQSMVARLRRLSDRQLAIADASVAAVRARRAAAAVRQFRDDRSIDVVRAVRARLDAMVAEENRLLARREDARRQSAALFGWVIATAGVLLVALGVLSTIIIRRYVAELARSQDSLKLLNEGLEERVAVRTADLRRANDEIQRFAYIVSHDLRSPLVNVMGFTAELTTAAKPLAELIDRAEAEAPHIVTEEARLAAREDLPEAISFIRTSTQKMDRLINAILKLAREGRRVLTPERLDMTQLVEGIRASMAHRLDEHGTLLRIRGALPDIVGDRLAIEQILSNLIENAAKYLKAGRPGEIDISGKRVGTRVVYEVADNGRGIDPCDHERIFDLFRRSGQQDRPGEGIGLAHVRALVYRLGGTIDCQSALDSGATFRVQLPAILAKQGKEPA